MYPRRLVAGLFVSATAFAVSPPPPGPAPSKDVKECQAFVTHMNEFQKYDATGEHFKDKAIAMAAFKEIKGHTMTLPAAQDAMAEAAAKMPKLSDKDVEKMLATNPCSGFLPIYSVLSHLIRDAEKLGLTDTEKQEITSETLAIVRKDATKPNTFLGTLVNINLVDSLIKEGLVQPRAETAIGMKGLMAKAQKDKVTLQTKRNVQEWPQKDIHKPLTQMPKKFRERFVKDIVKEMELEEELRKELLKLLAKWEA